MKPTLSAIRNRRSRQTASLSHLCRDQYLTVFLDNTAAEAVHHIREQGRKGHIFYLYVIDRDSRLCGVVSIRHLLLAKEDDRISSFCSNNIVSLRRSAPLNAAYKAFSESRFLSLPVVDDDNRLIGVVQAHELIGEYGNDLDELFEERTRGEIFELLGVKAEHASRGVWPTAVGRFPWLLINVAGGTGSALLIHHFGVKLPDAVLFLAFVPIILILSESIGMQTASIAIANLHRTKAKQSSSSSIAWRELFVAALLGLACGTLVAGAVYLVWANRPLALTVLLTTFGGAMWVSLVGNAIPRLFHYLKIDPRIAAGPLVLAIADGSTLLWYLLIASWATR